MGYTFVVVLYDTVDSSVLTISFSMAAIMMLAISRQVVTCSSWCRPVGLRKEVLINPIWVALSFIICTKASSVQATYLASMTVATPSDSNATACRRSGSEV